MRGGGGEPFSTPPSYTSLPTFFLSIYLPPPSPSPPAQQIPLPSERGIGGDFRPSDAQGGSVDLSINNVPSTAGRRLRISHISLCNKRNCLLPHLNTPPPKKITPAQTWCYTVQVEHTHPPLHWGVNLLFVVARAILMMEKKRGRGTL